MPLDLNDNKVLLSFAFGQTITMFTAARPMTIEDILEALCYTAGHALAQKEAQRFEGKKALRQACVRALDKGIADGSKGGETPRIILPGPGVKH